jgi:predicted site-specific integrase-resolvase
MTTHTLPKLLRLNEVADLLNICPDTLQGWVKAGKFLPARRLGVAWVWREDELAEYLSNLPPAVQERAQTAA